MSEITRKKNTGEPGNGGEFGHHAKSNSSTDLGGMNQDLGSDVNDWGSVRNVQEGSRTPWGTADHVDHTVPGIVQAGTPGHGGVKLSPERNREIPPALRNASGWYEEDCESNIVGMYFPEAFPHYLNSDDERRDAFEKSVRTWFPDQYEAATGTTVPFGESSEKDSVGYYADKQGETLLYSTGAKEDPNFPGYVNVTTRIHGEGTFTQHLVPLDGYADAQHFKHGAASVNAPLPAGSIDITPPADPPKPPSPRYRGVDTSGLTEIQRYRADGELDKRWRNTDGEIFTLRSRFENGDVTGKTVMTENSKKRFYLSTSDVPEGQASSVSYVTQVSKAVWDAAEAPDERTEGQRLGQELEQAQANYDRIRYGYGSLESKNKAQARLVTATDAHRVVSERESAISHAKYVEAQAEKERIALETARAAYAAAMKS